MNPRTLTLLALGAIAVVGCPKSAVPEPATAVGPTADDARAFVQQVDAGLRAVWVAEAEASWTYATDITDEHAGLSAQATEAVMAYLSKAVKDSVQFDGVEGLDADTARQLKLLRLSTSLPAPDDAAKREELATLWTDLEGMYGKGEYCPTEDTCQDLGDLEKIISTAGSPDANYDTLLDAWTGWRTISPPMREKYERFAALGNEGAGELGFGNLGELWRSGYDMTPAEFETEIDRLWEQVKPLYDELHCHVRAELAEKYGEDKVPLDGPIPAHLLGNMWAQSWDNLYPMLEPHPGQQSLDITASLAEQGYDHLKMVKSGESFFTSLGLDPLPQTFWERSMFLKPADRDVVCHASAWDVGFNDDLRIKMCIKVDAEDFETIHHELGHNYYYHYYYQKPVLFQNGAHDGFHEGIGDTLALSITPGYLREIGLMPEGEDSEELALNKQMQSALAKIAFLPFGRMIDQWRWDVFSGKVDSANYNHHWWTVREKFQGVAAPVERTEADFDPGAKYHIPGNTPYIRYFLAHILQYQFHEALCREAGHEGPLHTCSIYGSEAAGEKLQAMLEMGSSKPWPDALEAVAGTRQMDATSIINYYQPLMTYLEGQNADRTCGW